MLLAKFALFVVLCYGGDGQSTRGNEHSFAELSSQVQLIIGESDINRIMNITNTTNLDVWAKESLQIVAESLQSDDYATISEAISLINPLLYILSKSITTNEVRSIRHEELFAEISRGRMMSSDGRVSISSVNELDDPALFFSISDIDRVFQVLMPNESFASHIVLGGCLYDDRKADIELELDFEMTLSFPMEGHHHAEHMECFVLQLNATNQSWIATECPITLENINIVQCTCMQPGVGVLLWESDDHEDIPLLGNLIWFSCAFTCLSSGITIIVIIGLRLMKSLRSYMRMSFLVSTCFTECLLLAGIRYTDVPMICWIVASGLHYSILSCYSWLLCYILFLTTQLRTIRSDARLGASYYSAIGWGLPLGISLVVMLMYYRDYIGEIYCWMPHTPAMGWTIKGPAVVILVLTIIFIGFAIYNYYKLPAAVKPMHSVTWSGVRSCVILCPLVGGTWMLASSTIATRYHYFQALFSLFNSSLGIAIFAFMCYLNEEIRIARSREDPSRRRKVSNMPDKLEKLRVSANVDPFKETNVWWTSPADNQKTGNVNPSFLPDDSLVPDPRIRQDFRSADYTFDPGLCDSDEEMCPSGGDTTSLA